MQKEGLTQHKGYAMGKGVEPGGDFGVESFAAMNQGHAHPDAGMHTGKAMDEGMRSMHVARGSGSHGAQKHPDHGPHHAHMHEGGGKSGGNGKGSFGVESFRSMNG